MTDNSVLSSTPESSIDPVLATVLANRFESIVREMTNTLFRTGRSAILNLARDFSCCIVSADDQLLAAAEGLQVHVLGAGLQTASMKEFHLDLAEGDALLHNDPFLGNTHTADHTLLAPVFVNGEHVFTVSAKAHQADAGNSQPTTYMPFAKDLYEEGGLNFPCIRVQQNYKDVPDVIRMCQRRIRAPEVWYGDYLAAIGAVRIGEKRLKELVDQYGMDLLKEFQTWWLDYSERRMRKAIGAMPSAELVGSSTHDPLPGFPDGIVVNVGVKIDSDEELITVDLRDNIDCIPAGINLSEACATAGAIIGTFNCLEEDVPRNAGSFRRIKVKIRPNCIAGGLSFPHSSSMATTNILNRLINSIQTAFSKIGERYGMAEGAGSLGVGLSVYSGVDSHSGEAYVNQTVIGNNGGPGTPTCDGWVTYGMPDCAKTTFIDGVEVIEQMYPLRFDHVRLVTDSGGAGRFRGGPQSDVQFGPVNGEMQVFYAAEYALNRPKGVHGGLPGAGANAYFVGSDGSTSQLPSMGGVTLNVGQRVRGTEAGGGGYGDPLDRDPKTVLFDVQEKWVSPEAARDIYGVVVVDVGGPSGFTLDLDATVELRDSINND